ncbi:MAG: DUF296 domain-containing protein [Thermoplasmata archaeon]|nr:MAG: DUF296 domain-containing protein [Thermoplasmata archaeon]KAA0008294.1 MAG: DUF296 domain-containing protein [Thermoplasmata archaeon]
MSMFAREGNFVVAKFEDGEIIENLKALMKKLNARAAIILNGIGQFEHAVIGYFDGNDYIKKEIEGAAELVSLQGNIGRSQEDYIIHAHVTLGLKNHEIVGGHLIKGNVKVVNEIVLYLLEKVEIKRERKGKLMEMLIA